MTKAFVGYFEDFKPLMRLEIQATGGAAFRPVLALVDTGATDCTILPDLAKEIGLVANEEAFSHNVGSSGMKLAGRADYRFTGKDNNNMEVFSIFREARTFVDTFYPDVDLILGMNVLRMGSLLVFKGEPRFITGF